MVMSPQCGDGPPAHSSAPSAIKLTKVLFNRPIIYPAFNWRDARKIK